MSIVVAVKKNGRIAIASDQQVSFNSISYYGEGRCKINEVPGAYIGSTGWGVWDDILEDYGENGIDPFSFIGKLSIRKFFLGLWKHAKTIGFVNDQCEGKESPFVDIDSQFVIASQSGIYKVSDDLSVTEFERFCAIGSGWQLAIGAMHVAYSQIEEHDAVKAIAELGVGAACDFDRGCSGDPIVYDMPLQL